MPTNHPYGCKCHDCSPCPPTSTAEPTGCEPPLSIAEGIKFYVVDGNGCVKLLDNTDQNSLPVYVAEDGTIQMRDGSQFLPICLPALKQVEVLDKGHCINGLLHQDANGCLELLLPSEDAADEGAGILAVLPSGQLCFTGIENLFPTGEGIIYKDSSGDFQFITPPAVAGEILVSTGPGTQVWQPSATIAPPMIPDFRRLVVTNETSPGSGSFSSSTVNMSARYVLLVDPAGLSVVHENISVAASITSSGVGGLDTGSEQASVWYYMWLISNGTNAAGMFSLSSATPTMPAGYTYKMLIGAVRNDSFQNFTSFIQYDMRVWYMGENSITVSGLTTQAAIPTIVNFVPPIASEFHAIVTASLVTPGPLIALQFQFNLGGASSTGFILSLDAADTVTVIQKPMIIPFIGLIPSWSSGAPVNVNMDIRGFEISV